MRREAVGEVLQAIYGTEWPIRLEYVWDGGWVWVLVGYNGPAEDRRFPRVWFDDQIDGQRVATCMTPGARDQMESIPVMERDWLERGHAPTIEEAVSQLANELSQRIPDDPFAERWASGEWS